MKRDSIRRPDLFVWDGPMPVNDLDDWISSRGLLIPRDLRELWLRTGGGELFETESILSPLGAEALGDDVEGVNQLHRDRGLPPGYLVFHVGSAGLSAVRLADQFFVVMDEGTYTELAEFPTLEDWYDSTIHAEYAERYHLHEGAGGR